VDVVGSFIGVHNLQVDEMPDDAELVDVPLPPSDMAPVAVVWLRTTQPGSPRRSSRIR
jgi:hypothetical protein